MVVEELAFRQPDPSPTISLHSDSGPVLTTLLPLLCIEMSRGWENGRSGTVLCRAGAAVDEGTAMGACRVQHHAVLNEQVMMVQVTLAVVQIGVQMLTKGLGAVSPD